MRTVTVEGLFTPTTQGHKLPGTKPVRLVVKVNPIIYPVYPDDYQLIHDEVHRRYNFDISHINCRQLRRLSEYGKLGVC